MLHAKTFIVLNQNLLFMNIIVAYGVKWPVNHIRYYNDINFSSYDGLNVSHFHVAWSMYGNH